MELYAMYSGVLAVIGIGFGMMFLFLVFIIMVQKLLKQDNNNDKPTSVKSNSTNAKGH